MEMRTVGAFEAKTQLSNLLDVVERGERYSSPVTASRLPGSSRRQSSIESASRVPLRAKGSAHQQHTGRALLERAARRGTPMNGFVLDCSVVVAWCIDDEAAPETDALLERARDEGAVVPQHWPLELGNVLSQASCRGRLSVSDVTSRLDLLAELPLRLDEETAARGSGISSPSPGPRA
jgi:hypothetical protein